LDNVGVIVHPKLAACSKGDGCASRKQICAILRYKQTIPVENEFINVINDA
jgi:hypothetical protein